MIVLRTPKGWTGPAVVDGKQVEGTSRSHQVPLSELAKEPEHLRMLEEWLKSYKPEELFDADGRFLPELAELAPRGERRMGMNPHANGGLLLQDLRLADFRQFAVPVKKPGTERAEATRVLGRFLGDVMKRNADRRNFRIMGPDETESNRLSAVFEATDRTWLDDILPTDEHLGPDGRVMEVLSEHLCQGWLEGYLLTGRHGFFSCYEAFIHIIDSMFNQHAKWLKTTSGIPWRRPIASLNYLLTSHVWRQDHNGFSHQDPGFIDHVVNKKAEVVRVYLPPDANTLLSVADHCLRSRHYVNVIVAGKQPALQYLDMDAAVKHCTAGIGIWTWASNDEGVEPDVVMACAGDIPTLETLAAVDILRQNFPDLKVRVVNVVDLMTLQHPNEHPHGISDREFDSLFTTSKPIIFAFHGYPWLVHRLTYRRTNHGNLHVRGYKEEGTTTTPFDMVVMNDLDRFHLVMDVIERVPKLGHGARKLLLVREELETALFQILQRALGHHLDQFSFLAPLGDGDGHGTAAALPQPGANHVRLRLRQRVFEEKDRGDNGRVGVELADEAGHEPLRPVFDSEPRILPFRRKPTWTPASPPAPWATAMTSALVPFGLTTFWRSMTWRTEATRSRSSAARSKFQASAAWFISVSRGPMISSACPLRKRAVRSTASM